MNRLEYQVPQRDTTGAVRLAISFASLLCSVISFVWGILLVSSGVFRDSGGQAVFFIFTTIGACCAWTGVHFGWKAHAGVGTFFAVLLNGTAFIVLATFVLIAACNVGIF